MPMLSFYGNSLADRFPTHAEQFNQNINSLGFGSANLARRSLEMFEQYAAIALMFGVQAVDLRTYALEGHYDARRALSEDGVPLRSRAAGHGKPASAARPFLWNDDEQFLDVHIARIAGDLSGGDIILGQWRIRSRAWRTTKRRNSMNIANSVARGRREYPDRPALIYAAGQLSYRELDEQACRASNAFARLGVRLGDRVALCLHNVPEFAWCYLGALKLGAIVVSVNPNLTAGEIEFHPAGQRRYSGDSFRRGIRACEGSARPRIARRARG